MKAFADSVSSQKRAAADGECREESLLQETATKEAAMATRMEEVQSELKQARLALGNAHAEIDRLGVFSTQLKKVRRLIQDLFTINPLPVIIQPVTGGYISFLTSSIQV